MRKSKFNQIHELVAHSRSKKVICQVFAVALVLTFTSCKSESQQECLQNTTCPTYAVHNDIAINPTIATKNLAYGIMSDSNPIQIAFCEQVLDACVEAEMLDCKGMKTYRKIAKHPSVTRYMELIEECENETTFYDTVGEVDAWFDYCDYVLVPRGLAD